MTRDRPLETDFLSRLHRASRVLLVGAVGLGSVGAVSAAAQCVELAGGCPASGQNPPVLACTASAPQIGSAGFGLIAQGFPPNSSTAELVIGLCASPPDPIPAFIPLCPPGSSGCSAAVDLFGPIFVPFPVCGPGGCQPVWPLSIPNDPALVGLVFCAQAVALSPTGPGSCLVATNGVQVALLP